MRDGWVETTLGEQLSLEYGKPLTDSSRDGVGYPVFGSAGAVGMHSKPLVLEEPVIIVGRKGTAGAVYWSRTPCYIIDTAYYVKTKTDIDLRFLFLLLTSINLKSVTAQTGVPGLNRDRAYSLKCQVPPLTEQKRIVDLILGVDSYLEALQQQLESAKKSRNAVLHELLTAGGDDWTQTTIGDISSFISIRKAPDQLPTSSVYVGLEHLEPNMPSINNFDSTDKVSSSLTPFDVGDVLFGRLRPYLHKVALAAIKGFCSPEILVLRANSNVLPQMLLLYCDADSTINTCVERSAGTRMPRTSTDDLASIEVKLPPLAQQELLAGLFGAFDEEIAHVNINLEKTRLLRSGLLLDLLGGEHEIPVSYDKVIGAA
jgi:type I restriction enzyme S subunit